ncbi:hypothetical protein BYT27DRAFT_7191012 [Phlegmacium glaucopus]|nr:hypothetical protein BYT27DRAFT_7191012 [Phlegmacium glaucopus]
MHRLGLPDLHQICPFTTYSSIFIPNSIVLSSTRTIYTHPTGSTLVLCICLQSPPPRIINVTGNIARLLIDSRPNERVSLRLFEYSSSIWSPSHTRTQVHSSTRSRTFEASFKVPHKSRMIPPYEWSGVSKIPVPYHMALTWFLESSSFQSGVADQMSDLGMSLEESVMVIYWQKK